MSPRDLPVSKTNRDRKIAASVGGAVVVFTPRSEADKSFLEKALAFVEEAASRRLSTTGARQAAHERMPELSALWSLIPKTKRELHRFWMFVCVALCAMLMAYQVFYHPGPITTDLPKEIVDAIQAARPE